MEILADLINLLSDKIIEMNEKYLINIVLSKLDFTPKFYKIIKKDNKIFIKCHYYKTHEHFRNNFKSNNTPAPYYFHRNNDGTYALITYNNIEYKLKNFDNKSALSIIYADILIDLETKNYKIITSYYHIYKFSPNPDREALYSKIINILDDPSYYIIVNDIYDTELTININNINKETRQKYLSTFDNYFEKITNNDYKDHLKFYYLNKFNIIITNDTNDKIVINSIINNKVSDYKQCSESHISKDIDIKHHIDNYICINIKSGLLI
jgi:hypothetical protein